MTKNGRKTRGTFYQTAVGCGLRFVGLGSDFGVLSPTFLVWCACRCNGRAFCGAAVFDAVAQVLLFFAVLIADMSVYFGCLFTHGSVFAANAAADGTVWGKR